MSEQIPRVFVVSHAAVVPLNQEPFDALAREGADVTVVAPRALSTDLRGVVSFEALPNFAGRLVPLPVAIGGYSKAFGQRGIHLLVYRGLAPAIAEARPQVIFIEEEPYSLAARQAARYAVRMRIPYVVHENQNIARRLPPPFPVIRKWVLRHAAGVTMRNDAAGDIVRRYGFTGPLCSFPHGVDPARFPGPALQSDDGPEHPVVGFVGRLVPEKGLLDLIDALSAARAQTGRGSLLVVGDGPQMAEARARAIATGLPAEFTGVLAHDDVPAQYARMDIVAIPSRTMPTWMEQFGRIVIEANVAGVPVIVSDSGELPATVAQTGGGIVVPEANISALTDAVRALALDPARGRALGAAGREAVLQRFTPSAIARELRRFLAEVAS